MLNMDLLQSLLIVAIASGIVMTPLIQKIKEGINIKDSKTIIIVSFLGNMTIGTLFALSFSDVTLIYAIWIGLFSFIGADLIYKALEDKVFKPFSNIKEQKERELDIYEVK